MHGASQELAARSALAFRRSAAEVPARAGEPTLILLPAAFESNETLSETVRAAGWRGDAITLLPPRVVYNAQEVRGFTWFHALERDEIEPATFGDSLWQLERFVLDLLEAQADPCKLVLVGMAEGATLVLAAIPYLYDRIAGVIAIDGYLPTASWWTPPAVDLDGLPVWLIQTSSGECDAHVARILSDRGARVRSAATETGSACDALRDGLATWLAEPSPAPC